MTGKKKGSTSELNLSAIVTGVDSSKSLKEIVETINPGPDNSVVASVTKKVDNKGDTCASVAVVAVECPSAEKLQNLDAATRGKIKRAVAGAKEFMAAALPGSAYEESKILEKEENVIDACRAKLPRSR